MFLLRERALTAPEAAPVFSLAGALLFSLAAAVYDYKTRTVPLWFLLAGALVGVGSGIAAGRDAVSVLWALLPGVFLFLMNRAAGKIGAGDVGFVLCLALFLSLEEVLLVLLAAFFSAAAVSLGIIAAAGIRGRSARGKSLPFLCFFPPGVILCIIKVYGQV